MSWQRGSAEILSLIRRHELERVSPDAELAERMVETARQHLSSARGLAGTDPYLAYAAVYDAIRKSLAALLQVQGLRATSSGGHLAVVDAVRAQFGPSMGAILRPIDRIRVTRHDTEYPSAATYLNEQAVLDDIPNAEAVVEAAEKALPHLTPFTQTSPPAPAA